jgi:hypothetical protein
MGAATDSLGEPFDEIPLVELTSHVRGRVGGVHVLRIVNRRSRAEIRVRTESRLTRRTLER